jgi:hypothetical protein
MGLGEKMLNFRRWTFILITIGMLAGCGEKPAETVYQHLEAAVELEIPFEQQQEPLQKAEIKENDIFNEIITLGLNDYDKIVSLATEAISSIDAREAMVLKEKASIEESFLEFSKIEDLTENFKDQDLVGKVQALSESMEDRFENYKKLHDVYLKTIAEDRVLFEMLQDEELVMEDLQSQINIVNDLYKEIEKHKEKFNQSTNQYNQMKKDFYQAAELNVQYE